MRIYASQTNLVGNFYLQEDLADLEKGDLSTSEKSVGDGPKTKTKR